MEVNIFVWKFILFFKIHILFSRLAGLTNSNPVYFLTETPNHGKIKRIVQASNVKLEKRSVREREVWQFTHEDIKNGVIYFIAKPEMQISGNDSFRYRLEAPGVQPANGIFSFGITINTEATKTVSNPITEDVTGMHKNSKNPFFFQKFNLFQITHFFHNHMLEIGKIFHQKKM